MFQHQKDPKGLVVDVARSAPFWVLYYYNTVISYYATLLACGCQIGQEYNVSLMNNEELKDAENVFFVCVSSDDTSTCCVFLQPHGGDV